MQKRRVAELDIAKGVAIFLVVLGHTQIPTWTKDIFYPFHLPLFFLVSGYLLNTKANIWSFTKGRIYRLIIPYVSVSLLFYLLWIMKQQVEKDVSVTWSESLTGIAYGTGETLIVNAPLWFLACLFVTEILFLFVIKLIGKKHLVLQLIAFLLIGVAGFFISKVVHLPWSIDIALASLLFLFVGHRLKEWGLFVTKSLPNYTTVIAFVAYALLSYVNGTVDMNYRIYGDSILLFYLNGLTGSIFLLQVAGMILSINSFAKTFMLFGEHSINILMFHFGVFFGLNIINTILPITLNWIVYLLLGLSVSVLIGMFIRRYKALLLLFNGTRIKLEQTKGL